MKSFPIGKTVVCLLVWASWFEFSCAGDNAVVKPLLSIVKRVRAPERFKDNFIDTVLPEREYAELTIQNILIEPLVLQYKTDPEQCFIPIVRNQNGEVVSRGNNFGSTVSLDQNVQTIVLAPGNSKTIDLGYPWETVFDDKLKPGVYYFRVRFRRDDMLWESNEIEINYK